MRIKKTTVGRGVIYVIAFIFALHTTPFTYINSTFLSQYVGENNVGFIYTISSILTILAFICIRPILKRFGNYHTFGFAILIDFITLLIISFIDSGFILITAYVIGHIVRNLALFHLDIFLEDTSLNKDTGKIRGTYLTMMNLSFIIGPMIAGFIITDHDYWKVYLLGAILLLPIFFIFIRYLKHFKDPEYKDPKLFHTAKKVLQNKNMYSTFAIGSLLNFFYAWMVIYTPIYLIQHIGFSVSNAVFIIAIALIAFIIFQLPFGYIADKWLGEKEILITGFLIMAVSTASITFIDKPDFILWATILFITRIGASLIEIGNETYFFKKIDSSDINALGFFRMLSPVMYTVAPLLASLLLLIIDIRFLFLILGTILLYGIKYSLALKDTL